MYVFVVGSFDEELAALLNKLEKSGEIDDDSILGSQVPEELVHCSYGENEDVQDLSQPLELPAETSEERYAHVII